MAPHYKPNSTAVYDLATYLIPLLTANHYIILTGGEENVDVLHLPTNKNDHLIFAVFVPEVSDYILAADVYINQVAEGSGVQSKNIEALSYEINVVCWQHMLNGLNTGVTRSKELYAAIPNEWKDFLACILIATIINEPTPVTFVDYYNFDNQVLLMKVRIKNNKEASGQSTAIEIGYINKMFLQSSVLTGCINFY